MQIEREKRKTSLLADDMIETKSDQKKLPLELS